LRPSVPPGAPRHQSAAARAGGVRAGLGAGAGRRGRTPSCWRQAGAGGPKQQRPEVTGSANRKRVPMTRRLPSSRVGSRERLTAQAAAELWDTQPAQARAALDTVRHLASGATIEMRALLMDLHDAVLEQHGLVAALEAYGAVVRQRSGLQVEVRSGEAGCAARGGPPGPDQRLPRAHEEALYYVAREALANVVKHARATRATVTLVRDARVRLTVEDD